MNERQLGVPETRGARTKSPRFIRIFKRPVHHVRGFSPDSARLTVRIHKALVFASSQSGEQQPRNRKMSISSISAPAPVTTPDTSAAKSSAVQTDADAGDASEAQPPAPAPLPPGQGTRIDQLV